MIVASIIYIIIHIIKNNNKGRAGRWRQDFVVGSVLLFRVTTKKTKKKTVVMDHKFFAPYYRSLGERDTTNKYHTVYILVTLVKNKNKWEERGASRERPSAGFLQFPFFSFFLVVSLRRSSAFCQPANIICRCRS